jgi:hypothetical protein
MRGRGEEEEEWSNPISQSKFCLNFSKPLLELLEENPITRRPNPFTPVKIPAQFYPFIYPTRKSRFFVAFCNVRVA